MVFYVMILLNRNSINNVAIHFLECTRTILFFLDLGKKSLQAIFKNI